jgi:hypothetical protein
MGNFDYPGPSGIKVDFSKYTTWSFGFFAKFIFVEKKRLPKVIFELDMVHN